MTFHGVSAVTPQIAEPDSALAKIAANGTAKSAKFQSPSRDPTSEVN